MAGFTGQRLSVTDSELTEKVYFAQPTFALLRVGGLTLLAGLGCGLLVALSATHGVYFRISEGIFGAAACTCIGLWMISSTLLRFPRLKLEIDGLTIRWMGGSKFARWDSLGMFRTDPMAFNVYSTEMVSAQITGPNVDPTWKRLGILVISSRPYNVPSIVLCSELNRYRKRAIAQIPGLRTGQ